MARKSIDILKPTFIYNPHYTSDVFALPADVGLNRQTGGTASLVEFLSLRAGFPARTVPGAERRLYWYRAMEKSLRLNPGSPLAESWQADPAAVTVQTLKMRDALVEAGVDLHRPWQAPRLRTLADAEKEFDAPGPADRLASLVTAVQRKSFGPIPKCVIDVRCERDDVPPAPRRLLDACSDAGIQVTYTAPQGASARHDSDLGKVQAVLLGETETIELKGDCSFMIYQFPSEADAARCISTFTPEAEDFVAMSQPAPLSSWLAFQGKPTCGSRTPAGTSLLRLAVSLWETPVDIYRITTWLTAIVNPLPGGLRFKLAHAMKRSGGWHNTEWDAAITKYMDGVKEKKPTRAEVERLIAKWLPLPHTAHLALKEVKKFLAELNKWAADKETASAVKLPHKRAALRQLAEQSALLLQALPASADASAISYHELQTLCLLATPEQETTLHEHQAGALRVGASPADVLSDADSTLWADCYDFAAPRSPMECFSGAEKRELGLDDTFPYAEKELKARCAMILHTVQSHCAVEIADSKGRALRDRHPLLLRLSRAAGASWEKCVVPQPPLNSDDLEELKPMTLPAGPRGEVDAGTSLPMRPTETPTSLGTLFSEPLTYAMHALGIYGTDEGSLELIKGNVAHGVIAELFRGDGAEALRAIEERYEEALQAELQRQGLALLSLENRLELDAFRADLRECLQFLAEKMKDEHLEVLPNGTERELRADLTGTRAKLEGRADMILRKSDGTLLILDFKWTSKPENRQSEIAEGRAVQLALYRHMAEQSGLGTVADTGYFVLPAHELYLAGDTSGLLHRIAATYLYRAAELGAGRVEMAYGQKHTDTAYSQSGGLVPLRVTSGGLRFDSTYSEFKFFIDCPK